MGEWGEVESAGVPVLGSLVEYGDTGSFSRDTSVFAHGAKVMVPKTVIDPWGGGEVKLAGVPALGESWGVRGHQPFFRGHLRISQTEEGHVFWKS
jgi:hypothetical protein